MFSYALHPKGEHEHNCWTLIQRVLADHDKPVRSFEFVDDADLLTIFPDQIDNGLEGAVSQTTDIKALDIITLKYQQRWKRAWHCGIMLNSTSILHASRDAGRTMVDQLSDLKRKATEVRTWRLLASS